MVQFSHMQNYRTSNNKEEILAILEKSNESKTNILWQSLANHREVYEIELIDADELKGEVKFFINNANKVDVSQFAFLKLHHRDSVFKGNIKSISNNQIVMNIPEEIKTTELREIARYEFSPLEDKHVVLKVMNDYNKESFASIKVKIKDISVRGIGLLVSDKNNPFFLPGRFIRIESLGRVKMNEDEGEVVYCQRYRYRAEGKLIRAYRVGIKMREQFTQRVVDAFLRGEILDVRSELFAGPIIIEKETVEKIKQAKEKTLDKLKTSEITKNFLKELKINRNKDKYLTNHIGTLANIMCGLAKDMGWVTDKTMEKLIYVAYVHDIAFYGNPKLARIRDMEHFTSVIDRLNKQEQELFFKSPFIANEIAIKDPDAPEGADKILLQQKEKPDGSGFPYNITIDRIQPLSALFIISHDLTDYIMINKNWNIFDFIDKAEKKYSGIHFKKIIEQLKKYKIGSNVK
jgi:HD-GYP domain-containing protein (c-di-GMP phosphodiesterase class II)